MIDRGMRILAAFAALSAATAFGQEPAEDPPAPVAAPDGPAAPAEVAEVAPPEDVDLAAPEEEPEIDTAAQVQRTIASTDMSPVPIFPFFASSDGESFIKPVIQLVGSSVLYVPQTDTTSALANRLSTLALARFGLEGQLFGMLTFRSVFERNVGFSLARNGPVGTSIWEGNASIQARENYLRLHYEGFSLTAGIFRDPASVDFISNNILDHLGMDPYVRDPLLLTGFSQGQGVLVRYVHSLLDGRLSLGGSVAASGGNPLTTSLAFGFGGDVSALGTLFTAPLRALSNGIPGSDIQLNILSPSFFLSSDWVDFRTSFQIYVVDTDVTTDVDQPIDGWNFRSTLQVKLLDDMFRLMGTVSYRENEQLTVPDLTMLRDDRFTGLTIGSGLDFTYDFFSIGGNYYFSETSFGSNPLTAHYINVGATFWLRPPHVSVGVRWARSMASRAEDPQPRLTATDSFIVSLRLLI
jgi:hypothetical protein